MPSPVTGLHHVSSITGPPQAALDWYGGRLGLRLVKQTVNFDDPTSYHLYFADGEVRPGSFLTFFPIPGAARGRAGAGQPTALAYAVPPGAVDWWMEHLAETGDDVGTLAERFGARVLTLTAPDGLVYDLVETDDADGAWADGPVPPKREPWAPSTASRFARSTPMPRPASSPTSTATTNTGRRTAGSAS